MRARTRFVTVMMTARVSGVSGRPDNTTKLLQASGWSSSALATSASNFDVDQLRACYCHPGDLREGMLDLVTAGA
jgi:hypothetical protein